MCNFRYRSICLSITLNIYIYMYLFHDPLRPSHTALHEHTATGHGSYYLSIHLSIDRSILYPYLYIDACRFFRYSSYIDYDVYIHIYIYIFHDPLRPGHAALHEYTAAGVGQGTHYLSISICVYILLYIYIPRPAKPKPLCTSTPRKG